MKGTPCPRESKGQAEEIHDLAVTLTAAAATVKAGAKARVTVRFENKSEKALPLSFLRDHPLELIFRGEDGRALPTEGKNNCVSSVGLAKLAGVTLGPGGAVSSEIAVAATKRKHRAGPDACGTVDGSPLTPGKYQIAIDESPLWGIGLTKNATVEVVAK